MLVFAFLVCSVITAPVTSCSSTDRLCVEVPIIEEGKQFEVYFPNILFPIEVDLSQLNIAVYIADGAVNFDPCEIPLNPILNIPVSSEQSNIATISSIPVIIELDDKTRELVTPGTRFLFQLSDAGRRQCLLGPSVQGQFQSSIEIQPSPSSTTTSTTTEETDFPTIATETDPSANVPEDDQTSSGSRWAIIIVLIVIIVFVLFVIIMFLRRRWQKRGPPPRYTTAASYRSSYTLDHESPVIRQSMDQRIFNSPMVDRASPRNEFPNTRATITDRPNVPPPIRTSTKPVREPIDPRRISMGQSVGGRRDIEILTRDDTMRANIDNWASSIENTQSQSTSSRLSAFAPRGPPIQEQ